MKKLVLTAVAACVSLAMSAAYAETTKQDKIRIAQADTKADTTKAPAKKRTSDPSSVSDTNTSPGPSGTKGRTPSGKERGTGADAKSVNETGSTDSTKGRTPSGKQRKAGPDAKSVDDTNTGKKAEKN